MDQSKLRQDSLTWEIEPSRLGSIANNYIELF